MMQEKYKESENHLLSCSSDVTVLASVLPGTHSHGQPYVSCLIPHMWLYPLPPSAPHPDVWNTKAVLGRVVCTPRLHDLHSHRHLCASIEPLLLYGNHFGHKWPPYSDAGSQGRFLKTAR